MNRKSREKRIIKNIIKVTIFIVFLFTTPERAYATTCVFADDRYIIYCKGESCTQGFRVTYESAGVSLCASKSRIDDLDHIELTNFNFCMTRDEIINADGVYEFLFPTNCLENGEYCDYCKEHMKVSKLSEGNDLNRWRNEIGRELQIEHYRFYIRETISLFVYFIPLLIGLSIFFVVKKELNTRKIWARAIILMIFQAVLTFLLMLEITTSWMLIAFDLSIITLIAEFVYVLRINYLKR